MRSLRLSILKALALAICVLFVTGCAAMQSKAKADYTTDVASMDFVFVKGGTFQMGSAAGYKDEQPVHNVTIPDLLVGMHEVSFAQFDQYCITTPTTCEPLYDEGWGRGQRPIINLTWHQANAYAMWLSQQTGQRFRLPTEAEWEYFARAGTSTKYWSGDKLPKGKANCRDCTKKPEQQTTPVGTFSPNPWGLYDTIGNVREWTQDDYLDNYAGAPNDGSPVIAAESRGKVARGGAFRDKAEDARSASRDWLKPNRSSKYVGFRLVLEPDGVNLTPKAE